MACWPSVHVFAPKCVHNIYIKSVHNMADGDETPLNQHHITIASIRKRIIILIETCYKALWCGKTIVLDGEWPPSPPSISWCQNTILAGWCVTTIHTKYFLVSEYHPCWVVCDHHPCQPFPGDGEPQSMLGGAWPPSPPSISWCQRTIYAWWCVATISTKDVMVMEDHSTCLVVWDHHLHKDFMVMENHTCLVVWDHHLHQGFHGDGEPQYMLGGVESPPPPGISWWWRTIHAWWCMITLSTKNGVTAPSMALRIWCIETT